MRRTVGGFDDAPEISIPVPSTIKPKPKPAPLRSNGVADKPKPKPKTIERKKPEPEEPQETYSQPDSPFSAGREYDALDKDSEIQAFLLITLFFAITAIIDDPWADQSGVTSHNWQNVQSLSSKSEYSSPKPEAVDSWGASNDWSSGVPVTSESISIPTAPVDHKLAVSPPLQPAASTASLAGMSKEDKDKEMARRRDERKAVSTRRWTTTERVIFRGAYGTVSCVVIGSP